MMGLQDLIPVSRFKIIFIIVIFIWITLTILDFNFSDIRSIRTLPHANIASFKDRQLLYRISDQISLDLTQESSLPFSSSSDSPFYSSTASYNASNKHSSIINSKSSTQDFNSSLSNENEFQEWLKEKEKLNKNVKKVCQKYGQKVRKFVPLRDFMFDSKHNILFCRNAKVGTTSWMTNFLLMSDQSQLYKSGQITSKILHRTVPDMFRLPDMRNSEFRNLVKSSTSFSIVRHPFERIVSAYQDKIVDQSDPFFTRIVEHIIDQYGGINFSNFAQMILDVSAKKCRSPNKCGLDKHWRPFISRCGYCDVPYKIIAKAENFEADQKFIGHMANVTFEKIESHVSSGGSTKSLAKKYFSELETDVVLKLYKIYQVDFEMFQYSPDLFIEYSKNKN